jgi:formylglycine-generating enzyme required for sulfatase activity
LRNDFELMRLLWTAGGWLIASAVVFANTQAPSKTYTESVGGTVVKFDMVPVPGGTVTIDGTAVRVEPFFIGRTEVTWDLYDIFRFGLDTPKESRGVDATTRPSHPYGAPDYNWGHNGFPVMSVTRNAAEQFCKWLSVKTGKTYRLPTEAEWTRAAELAAAGASSPESRDAVAWHAGNANGTTHAVAMRKPDALGLSDLFGNTAEWVVAKDNALVTRGGSFRDPLDAIGPAARAVQDSSWNERDPQLPKSQWWLSDGPFVGFRVVASGN